MTWDDGNIPKTPPSMGRKFKMGWGGVGVVRKGRKIMSGKGEVEI